jgi:hypothetical protein
LRRITLLAVFWLTAHLSAALSPANAQQTGDMSGVPPLIAEAATAYLEECESFDASPVPTDRFIAPIDLNDDGRSDYIIDTTEINASCFCGSGGCTIEAWVSERESYGKASRRMCGHGRCLPRVGYRPC